MSSGILTKGAFALCFASILAPGGPAAAATATTSFGVQIQITNDCTITSTDMNFGSVGFIAANVDATSTITVRCTVGSAYSIALNLGVGTGTSIAARKLTGAGGTLDYNLYQDTARTIVWGTVNPTQTVQGTGNGTTQPITVYGRVPPQSSPGTGIYNDTITAEITY